MDGHEEIAMALLRTTHRTGFRFFTITLFLLLGLAAFPVKDTLAAPTETGDKCYDGRDNDRDGLIDGDDPDCEGAPPSEPSLEDRVAGLEALVATLQSQLAANTSADNAAHHSPYTDANAIAAVGPHSPDFTTLLSGVSRIYDPNTGYDTVRFEGMNVQIVNGTETTGGANNGTGNLIIGYNEIRLDEGEVNYRDGSHMLVIGEMNNYSVDSYGGMVVGYFNQTYSNFASVSGGTHNTANGNHSSISGGNNNIASGIYASVSGGYYNTASSQGSSVSGGYYNTAGGSGSHSSVSGGYLNTASGQYSSISGGSTNNADWLYASVSGGVSNTASGRGSSVSGGNYSTASGEGSSVSGGDNNTASGRYATVSGGRGNMAQSFTASINGGNNNIVIGHSASILGGEGNIASGDYSSVSGGDYREAASIYCWEGGPITDC